MSSCLLRACTAALLGAVICGSVAIASAPPVGFSTAGEWQYSSLAGANPGRGSIWARDVGAAATWHPGLSAVGPVRVSLHVVVHPGNDARARVEIACGGAVVTQTVNTAAGETRWMPLGTFPFAGGSNQWLRITKTAKGGNLRASAAKFEVLDPKNTNFVWQTLVMDEAVPRDPALLAPPHATFDDLAGHWARREAGVLAAQGVLPGVSSNLFAPDAPACGADLAAAMDKLAPGGDAAAGLASRKTVMCEDIVARLVSSAKASGKCLGWMRAPSGAEGADDAPAFARRLGLLAASDDPAFKPGAAATRAQAAALLRRFQHIVAESGPPADRQWELAFHDEFDGASFDPNVWKSAQGETWGSLQSSRWPENAVVAGGLLRLVTRKEARGKKEWTTAFLSSKAFRQRYGYWEARYRYAAATGLNQAFWMNAGSGTPKGERFEIDVNEGHYPNFINMTLHQDGMPSISKRHAAAGDLADDFHVYAVDWNEREIVFYLDGREIDRKPNTKAHGETPVHFSTAVLLWAGPVTYALDGRSMDVDWVRVYRRKAE